MTYQTLLKKTLESLPADTKIKRNQAKLVAETLLTELSAHLSTADAGSKLRLPPLGTFTVIEKKDEKGETNRTIRIRMQK